jgi:hypothetical protein
MERAENEYAATYRVVFFQPAMGTTDMSQLLPGFLVTPDGVAWYRCLVDEWVAGPRCFSEQLVLRGVPPLQLHIQKLLGVDETVAAIIWDHYLRFEQYWKAESATQLWERHRSLMILDISGLRHVPYRPVAEIALIGARLPCSNAGVERAFSRLGLIFGDHRRLIHDDLVVALSIVKLHRFPNCPASSSVLENVREGLEPDSVDRSTGDADGARPPPDLPADRSLPTAQPELGLARLERMGWS